uniref:Myosin motor domain-containing protein n=1 Tax=Haptolina brevifila TaxID=156173 RepID=A0A7S2DIW8_9EUKA
METLRNRHTNNLIYTKNGAVLVAINPYKEVNVGSQQHLERYKSSMALENEPPHIFATAAATHRALISDGCNQAVVISGESGAGKTESARYILQYLRFVSNASEALEERVTKSQPITEAFGCAKTIRNDNSSRFGKFLKLYFDHSAKIKGASLSTYLLEKSRITHIGSGERAYHIFYELLRGSTPAELQGLKLPGADVTMYQYLKHGDQVPAKYDVIGFKELKEAFTSQSISIEEQNMYWQLLAGVLLLGNVVFDPSKPEAAAIMPQSASALDNCEHNLGLQAGSISKALTKRKIKAGAEMVEQDLKLDAANDGRDALSKAIYSKLFDFLIVKINEALRAGNDVVSEADARIVGIVDIFGFEVFKVNSLEQLCINFTNEKLQALFTKTVFEETLKAYAADGIDAAEITYTDNKELLAMFDVPNTGLFNLLAEECMVPKGSDKGFTEKLHDAQKKGSPLSQVKGLQRSDGFQITHFAGSVTYSTKDWLNKNKDPLNGDLVVLMQFSDNRVLRDLFTDDSTAPPAGGKGAKFKSNKFKGVVDTFRTQLTALNSVLSSSQLHFVRCFKPNDSKAADSWEDDVVSRQLHTSGVLDALRVARTGFPDRMVFADFSNMFGDIAGVPHKDPRPARDKCLVVLDKMEIPEGKYKIGKERVFLSLGVLDALKTKRTEKMAKVAIVMQAGSRGMAARKRAKAIREARLKAQQAMEAAAQGTDIPAIQAAIQAAVQAGVGLAPKGAASLKLANARLQELQRIERERLEATQALETAMAGYDMNALRSALQAAGAKNVDPAIVKRGSDRLAKLEEEERLRIEEEKRLAAVAAAEKEAAERKLAEERRKRAEEETARRKMEEESVKNAKAAEERAKQLAEEQAEREKANAAEAAQLRALEEAEEKERLAIEEEEQLRQLTLDEIEKRKIQFRSEPSDVLEYAVYLGMDLKEDIMLLWIADEALQAEDPEGWDQAESPNGDVYYIHTVTQQVLWQHPLDYNYQQKYYKAKNPDSDTGDGEEAPSAVPPTPPPPAPSAHQAPSERKPDPEPPGRSQGAPGSFGGVPDRSLSSDEQLRAKLQQLIGTRHEQLSAMLLEPACTQRPVQCYVIRHKSRMGAARFDFFMSLSQTKDMYCFTGKKINSVAGKAAYQISLDQDDSRKSKTGTDTIIGRIRAQHKSMDYTLYDNGSAPGTPEAKKDKSSLRRELMHVHFVNSLRNRNPGAMDVALPDVDREGNAVRVTPEVDGGKDGLEEKLKAAATGRGVGISVFKNREPKWNAESQMYQLDFRGRATHASCKNIQLTRKDGDQSDAQMLMGKVDDNKFNVDFQYPFSALQAFAFALVVFDNSSSGMTLS